MFKFCAAEPGANNRQNRGNMPQPVWHIHPPRVEEGRARILVFIQMPREPICVRAIDMPYELALTSTGADCAIAGCRLKEVPGEKSRVGASGRPGVRDEPTLGQAPAAKTAAAVKSTWTPPRTPDGQPDLQGAWTNNCVTPLQRPKELAGKEFTRNRSWRPSGRSSLSGMSWMKKRVSRRRPCTTITPSSGSTGYSRS
jgi:hypothetical protein